MNPKPKPPRSEPASNDAPCPPRSGNCRAQSSGFLNDMPRADVSPAPAPVFGYRHSIMTAGIAAFGPDFVQCAIGAVRTFDASTAENDPLGERDRGTVRMNYVAVNWAIDAYDLDLAFASPKPADPTRRISFNS